MSLHRFAPIVPALVVLCAPAATADGFQATPDSSAPTPIEQALIDQACSAKRSNGSSEADYDACTGAQLTALRVDFGRNLKGLSNAERRTLDSICNRVQTAEGRDAYVGCLANQITALRARRNRSKPADPEPAGAAASALVPASDVPLHDAPPAAARSIAWWIGGGIVLLAAAAGVFVVKSRRRSVKCRVCGSALHETGDLCQVCRHDAAEALRRAALERTAVARAQEEEAQRQRARAEEQQRELARREEEERARHEERLRLEEQARHEAEEARRRDEEARRRREAEPSSETFDPYAILGLSHEVDRDAIEAAYGKAKAKYAPEEVEHLGDEVQAHYRLKAAAVERAYEMLLQRQPSRA